MFARYLEFRYRLEAPACTALSSTMTSLSQNLRFTCHSLSNSQVDACCSTILANVFNSIRQLCTNRQLPFLAPRWWQSKAINMFHSKMLSSLFNRCWTKVNQNHMTRKVQGWPWCWLACLYVESQPSSFQWSTSWPCFNGCHAHASGTNAALVPCNASATQWCAVSHKCHTECHVKEGDPPILGASFATWATRPFKIKKTKKSTTFPFSFC